MVNRIFTIVCVFSLVLQVQLSAASAPCPMVGTEGLGAHSVEKNHNCCISGSASENCDQCNSCDVCTGDEQASSAESNNTAVKLVEYLSNNHLHLEWLFSSADITFNDKNIDSDLIIQFKLPPPAPVYLN
ncbi:hypothetical protein CHISP_3223 [Chitinispirillum alkaliphilum]|nr:hypothetical protein CHISP_3223 [Chitinispirillum alkaliphilum]